MRGVGDAVSDAVSRDGKMRIDSLDASGKKKKKMRKSDGNMILCLLNESSHAGRDNDWPSVGHSVRISPRSARTS